MKRRNTLFSIVLSSASAWVLFFLLIPLPVNAATFQNVVTYNIVTESNAGMDGPIQWQSAFLLNDGRIASFGTGNHVSDQSNAVRIIDPVTTPGTVTTYNEFPWTQSGGVNRYVSNYDNHPSIYLPSDGQYGKAIWAGHGVFDFNPSVKSWIRGDRSPNAQGWNTYVRDGNNTSGVYNPVVAWCSAIDKGVWFGGSGGGMDEGTSNIRVIERDGTGGYAWKITYANLASQGVVATDRARNEGVCVGAYFYLGGNRFPDGSGTTTFQKINVNTRTLVSTLTPRPRSSGDYFPQAVYDSRRNKIVVIGIKLQEYDILTNTWTDITPSGWPGYTSPAGVYHPMDDAVYFRGIPVGGGTYDGLRWNKIKFGGEGAKVPSSPVIQIQ